MQMSQFNGVRYTRADAGARQIEQPQERLSGEWKMAHNRTEGLKSGSGPFATEMDRRRYVRFICDSDRTEQVLDLRHNAIG